MKLRHVRSLAVLPLLLGCFSSRALDLATYKVVHLTYGVNLVNLGTAGPSGTVILGWRENHNAHGFGVATFYWRESKPGARLEIMGIWDEGDEKLTVSAGGGADCVLHDFRLLTSLDKNKPAILILANRDSMKTYADKENVAFKFYILRFGTEGIPQGDPGTLDYKFDLVETRVAKHQYCDVGEAFLSELGLGDYGSRP